MPDMVQVRRPPTNRFAEEPELRIGRSQFDMSHGVKMGFDASYLYPFYVEEILPGDTFTVSLDGFCRIFSPLDAPLMDNISVETFFFFIPNRLVWDSWQYFMGEHDDKGTQDTTYTVPHLSSSSPVSHNAGIYSAFGLAAYMGIPHGLVPDDVEVCSLPFRGYSRVYNEWFRDQNVIDEVTVYTGDANEALNTNYSILKSAKRHDYFTSSLPYLQKGDAQDIMGGLTTLDVETLAVQGNEVTIESGSGQRDLDSAGANVIVDTANTGSPMFVDVSSISVDVNQLRESIAIQRLLERDARGGTRYVEKIKTQFGVTSPDFRMQRTEYLGGGKSWINITPVANQSDQDSTIAASGVNVYQGELKGIGAGVIRGHGWAKSFTEHGYVLGIIRARADLTYFQGLDRMWSKETQYDFYVPALAHLGEQSVLNKELYVTNTPATDDAVFGYQERWQEYRFRKSRIVGILNPDATSALDHWHLAEDFAATPTLNQTFIEDQTPMSRIVSTTAASDFLLDLWINAKAARPIPVHSIPSLIGMHF